MNKSIVINHYTAPFNTFLLCAGLAMLVSLNTLAAGGTLLDVNGRRMRATPMVIGKALPTSVAYAENYANWTKLRDTYHINTVRLCCVDAWYYMRGYDSWDTFGALPHIKKAVQNATSAGMNIIINHHVTGENEPYTTKNGVSWGQDLGRNHNWRVLFWRNIAMTFKDNNRVYFELSNEPVYSNASYLNSTFRKNLLDIYYMVRYEAPNRQIQLFSFAHTQFDMRGIANNYSSAGIDWSKTSIAFHGYSDTSSAKVRDIKNTWRVICTEWDYPGTHSYVKVIDGEAVNAQTWERLGISWSDWRDWGNYGSGVYTKLNTVLLPDAKAKGYWW